MGHDTKGGHHFLCRLLRGARWQGQGRKRVRELGPRRALTPSAGIIDYFRAPNSSWRWAGMSFRHRTHTETVGMLPIIYYYRISIKPVSSSPTLVYSLRLLIDGQHEVAVVLSMLEAGKQGWHFNAQIAAPSASFSLLVQTTGLEQI